MSVQIHTVSKEGFKSMNVRLTIEGANVLANGVFIGSLEPKAPTYNLGTRLSFKGNKYIINAGDDYDTIRLTNLAYGFHWDGTHKVADCHNVTRSDLAAILGNNNFEITLRR